MERFLLVILVTLLLAFLTIKWPVAASLGIYGFLLPFDSVLLLGQAGSIHLHLVWFVAAACCGLLLLTALTVRGFASPPRAALWLFLFAAWASISSAWAINPQSAMFRVPVIALMLSLYLIGTSSYVSEREMKAITWFVILGGCAAAMITLYQFSQGSYVVYDPTEDPDVIEALDMAGRAMLGYAGRVTNPNTLAATLILPFSLALGTLVSARRWMGRLFSLAVLVLLVFCIAQTQSRGALVATVVIVLIFLWRFQPRSRVTLPLTVFGGTVSCALVAMPDLVMKRFHDTLRDRGAGRLDIWDAGLHAFQKHSVLGAGLDCFPQAMDKYLYVFIHDLGGAAKGAHNAFLGAAVELGIVGLALMLTAIVEHFLLSARTSRSQPDLASRRFLAPYEAACGGLLICGLFLDLAWEEYFWFAWMLLVMAARIRQMQSAAHVYTLEYAPPDESAIRAGERLAARQSLT